MTGQSDSSQLKKKVRKGKENILAADIYIYLYIYRAKSYLSPLLKQHVSHSQKGLSDCTLHAN